MSAGTWTGLDRFYSVLFGWLPAPFQAVLPILIVAILALAIWRIYKG